MTLLPYRKPRIIRGQQTNLKVIPWNVGEARKGRGSADRIALVPPVWT